MAYAGALWLAVMLFPHGFAALFSADEALIDFTARALRVYMAVGVLFGVQLACQQTFIALGNARSSLFLAVLRKIYCSFPSSICCRPYCPWTRPWPCTSPSRWPTSSP